MTQLINNHKISDSLFAGCTALLILGALLVIGGWIAGSEAIMRPLSDSSPMQFNTALSFLLLGIALLITRRAPSAAVVLAALIALAGVTTLLDFSGIIHSGLDDLFITPPESQIFITHPGRMAPNTAVAFILAALAVVAIARMHRQPLIAEITGMMVLAIGALSVMGYLLGDASYEGWGGVTRMAVSTAACFMLAGLAIVCRIRSQSERTHASLPLCATMAVGIVAFLCDLHAHHGYNAGMLYVLFVFMALQYQHLGVAYLLALVATGCIVLCYFLSPTLDLTHMQVVVNRSLAIGVVWVAALAIVFFVGRYQRERERSGHVHQRIAECKQNEADMEATLQRLVQSNIDLEQFAYAAAHDLQEPLRMVIHYTDRLGEQYQNALDEKGRYYLQTASEGARRMQTLIDDLLDYSRLDGSSEQEQEVDCRIVLEQVKENLRLAINESGAVITAGSLPVIQWNAARLSRLLQNLIANAITYRKTGIPPEIHITAEQEQDGWRFCVSDTGIGIKPAYLEQIFVAFKRLHGRDEYAGNGLGLAICEKLVKRRGGRIWAESTLHEGSRFYFIIPH